MTKLKDWSQNLNKKKYLYNEAERLYIYNFLTIDELASRLNLNRKTIMDWKNKRKIFSALNNLFMKKCMNLHAN